MDSPRRDAKLSRLAIVADDLTSATDCGVRMMTGGYNTVVSLNPDRQVPPDADIVAFDTDSRAVSADKAYRATREAVAGLIGDACTGFYKSIDSTLRGNLGTEFDGLMDAGGFDAAIVAPAFPSYGRTTVDGRQLLHGQPIHETEFGTDPTSPVKTSIVAERFAEQSRRQAAVIPLEVLRAGAERTSVALAERRRAGAALLIFDAQDECDLKRICTIAAAMPGRFLWVGSTGLARYVPGAVGLDAHPIEHAAAPAHGCVLVVAGSASETTRRQLDRCAAIDGFAEVQVDARMVARGGQDKLDELAETRHRLALAVEGAGVVALTLTSTRPQIDETRTLAAARGFSDGEIEEHLVAVLAGLVTEVHADGANIKGLVMTGGSTAKAVVSRLGAEAIAILGEVEPGIPLCRINGGREILAVTKAGGFGQPEAIVSSVEKIADYGRG